jgi:hypothetical protein
MGVTTSATTWLARARREITDSGGSETTASLTNKRRYRKTMTNFLMIGSPVDIRPTLERWYRDFYESWPDDLKAAFLAGCEMEYGSEMTPAGLRVTARTKNRIGVVRDPDGRVTVYSER